MKIKKTERNQRIIAIYIHKTLYAGVANKLIDVHTRDVLCTHEKSIRHISGNDRFIGCCSYDGTATVLDAITNKIKDKIEGPDTEIKCIAFSGDFIALSTRGRTVWILEDFEISKILEDHSQDVKGCCFTEGRLYSWSYDGSIKWIH